MRGKPTSIARRVQFEKTIKAAVPAYAIDNTGLKNKTEIPIADSPNGGRGPDLASVCETA
jgi:hypothetical protein